MLRGTRGRAASETDLEVLDFQDFGRRAIVRHGLGPDGFVQMAFQLAYARLTDGTASTYESVSTKRFLHGRTEAMRSVSAESVSSYARVGPAWSGGSAKRLHSGREPQRDREALPGGAAWTTPPRPKTHARAR
jgi:hypothetical protein